MSGRHICICGKKRGHNPITITVTQCPNKHEIKTTGLDSLPECDPSDKKQSPQETNISEPTNVKEEKAITNAKISADEQTNKKTSPKSEDSSEKSENLPKKEQNPKEERDSESKDVQEPEKSVTTPETQGEGQPDEKSRDQIANVVDLEAKTPESVDKSDDPTKGSPDEERKPESTELDTSQQSPEAEPTEESSHNVESGKQEEIENHDATIAEPDSKDENPEDVRGEESNKDPNNKRESVADEQPLETEENENAPDANLETPQETPIEEATSDGDEEKTENVEDQTVMYMMDASLNTTPFLDNLFVAKPRTSLKTTSDYYQCKQCMLEIFVFGRHTKNCRYSFLDQNVLNCLSDGNTILEAIGKLSFPVKRNGTDDDSYSVYSQLNSNILKGKINPKNELANIYTSTFKKLEAHVKKDRLMEMMKCRNQANHSKAKQIGFIHDNTDKAIQLDRNSSFHRLSDFCVQFTSIPAPSITRSIQFDSSDHKTEAKWYDIFLMCFGIKTNEDSDINDDILVERIHGISSIEISKYMKI